jgi:hypothetical protein
VNVLGRRASNGKGGECSTLAANISLGFRVSTSSQHKFRISQLALSRPDNIRHHVGSVSWPANMAGLAF